MKPLAEWPLTERRHITGVFTDIDDTLTTRGVITADALQALADLRAAGLQAIAVTGRHIGWCERLAQGDAAQGIAPLPLDALLAENGALALVPENIRKNAVQTIQDKSKQLLKIYQQSYPERAANQARMQQAAERVLREVPQARLAQNQGGRETDIAFDYNEHHHLSAALVQQVLETLHSEGMHTSVSSIHIHGCYGDFNKWQGACWLVQRLYGRELASELDQWVFVGDSGNDQPMFEHFRHSVGVANIHHCAAGLTHLPRYLTTAERGAGFAELARAILQARSTP
ncbi:MAG: HAD family hydrolase [Comamonadaceae bacterium CG1_02_60_18]|nr:MAG: HAD family hydrolase [Comamonadaceae bacterium CG1_02_60_18]PIQ53676.1 MAG: HAD family hydrolase [Comamonadaceae bacterium CG12_big_fil_rev_8_21_14_0_65_59_15]